MNKQYIVRLSDEERTLCETIIKKLKGSSQKVRRAHILLKTNANRFDWTDALIAEAFNCRTQAVENLRKRVLCEGFGQALNGKKRPMPPTPNKLDEEGELNSLRCAWGHHPKALVVGRCNY